MLSSILFSSQRICRWENYSDYWTFCRFRSGVLFYSIFRIYTTLSQRRKKIKMQFGANIGCLVGIPQLWSAVVLNRVLVIHMELMYGFELWLSKLDNILRLSLYGLHSTNRNWISMWFVHDTIRVQDLILVSTSREYENYIKNIRSVHPENLHSIYIYICIISLHISPCDIENTKCRNKNEWWIYLHDIVILSWKVSPSRVTKVWYRAMGLEA